MGCAPRSLFTKLRMWKFKSSLSNFHVCSLMKNLQSKFIASQISRNKLAAHLLSVFHFCVHSFIHKAKLFKSQIEKIFAYNIV